MAVNYGSLPFQEAVDYFNSKINLPTAAWTDIWEGMHARAFVVAGATKDELLTDLRNAVRKSIEDGTTLEQFRKDFDTIVKNHGWPYKGGRNWRTRVIYDTNLRQAYNAGREKQMRDPELRKRRPYGLYKHSDAVEHPRPEHLAWDNTVLPLDDPWWETYTPQNGWGCQCKKFMVSERDLKRRGLTVSQAPPVQWEEKTVGVRGPNPRNVRVPVGIDPGFAYNPGTAAWGRHLSDEAMETWRASKEQWETLTPGGWAEAGRPEQIPLSPLPVVLGRRWKTQDDVVETIRRQIGADEKTYDAGVPVLVNADTLGAHIDPARAEYLPLLDDLMTNPFEVWLAFERHTASGQVALRSRIIKAYDLGKGRGVLLSANATKGRLEAWTFLPVRQMNYLQKQRQGQLLRGAE